MSRRRRIYTRSPERSGEPGSQGDVGSRKERGIDGTD